MVALVRHGRTVASWTYRPADGVLYVAELGSGAERDGRPLRRAAGPADPALLGGAVLTRFLPPPQRAAVEAGRVALRDVTAGRRCAGVDYPLVAEGAQDFVLFWRTLPWDHAPGALLVDEAGGLVAHLDGQGYRPGHPREGLLAAADPRTHARVLGALGL
jgi:fructose-1,6-bisphosphatase/inositol monophosphatase family enzyme